jgi:hypothetical protein
VEHATASCKCGAVELDIGAAPTVAVNCHCHLCRSINGTAFSTYVPVQSSEVRVAKGGDNLGRYGVTDHAVKHWCRTCGTPLFNTNTIYPGMAMVYLGALRSQHSLAPRANIFCSSKLEWVDTISQLKSYPEARDARA